MTIICPRCAARFSVAQTTGITCPACGAKLALRDDPSRRSSTPAVSGRRSSAPVPIIDLPVPKRAISVSLDPQSGSSRGGPASLLSARATALRPKERWRLRPEQLGELPEPVSDAARHASRRAALRSSPVGKVAPPPPAVATKPVLPQPMPAPAPIPVAATAGPVAQAVPGLAPIAPISSAAPLVSTAPAAPTAPIERAQPRIPVTRPEIPAGLPVRPTTDEPSGKLGELAAANPAAAATRQELEPVAAAPKASPQLGRVIAPAAPASVSPSKSAAEPTRPPTAPTDAAVAAPVVQAVPAVPVVQAVQAVPVAPVVAAPTPSRMPDAPAPTAAAAPPAQARPNTAAPPTTERSVTSPPAAPAETTAAARAAETEPSPQSPPADSEQSGEAGTAESKSGETVPAATSAETHLLDEAAPPPAVQLGWVIAVLLGLALLLVAWIVYRATVGH